MKHADSTVGTFVGTPCRKSSQSVIFGRSPPSANSAHRINLSNLISIRHKRLTRLLSRGSQVRVLPRLPLDPFWFQASAACSVLRHSSGTVHLCRSTSPFQVT